ncbi:MAG: cytochrome-c peroxidase [Myxococcota bacterium]
MGRPRVLPLAFGGFLFLSAAAAGRDAGSILPLPKPPPQAPAKVELGRMLFLDPLLSADGKTSCASCHVLEQAGSNGQRFPTGSGGVVGELNTPTVFNVAFNPRQFWDGRADSLEAQIEEPIVGRAELASSWEKILPKLRATPAYAQRFAALYPNGVSATNVKDALAAFERSLVIPESRFDRYLRGDPTAITQEEKAGYELFRDYGCSSCHQGANVGGNMFQRFGVMANPFARKEEASRADRGRFNVTGDPRDLHVFRVPSLRLAAQTAPYFHDGSAETLADAIDDMGEYQLGVVIPQADKALLIRFLEALSSPAQGTMP